MNFNCPVDTSSSKTARQHTQLVPRRTGSKPTAQISLPRPVTSKFTRLEPLGLPCLGAMLEAYHKRHPKPKTIAELKEVLQLGDLGQPTSGTNRQSCQRVLKAIEKTVLQLRVDISNIHSNCNVVTLLLLLERCYFTS